MPTTYHPSGRRYKGYHSPRFFWTNPRARHFSNARLLLVLALVGVGVGLLTWALSLAQHMP